MVSMYDGISDGEHYLSGVGNVTLNVGDYEEITTNVALFCLDGIVYGAYEDPCDGYRSYGCIHKMENNIKCDYNFPAQKVIVRKIKEHDKDIIYINDYYNNQEVLAIGTDYFDSYYPCAIFRYTPENLEINQNKL